MSGTVGTVGTSDQGVTGFGDGNTKIPKARYWIWTWNNYEEIDIDNMKTWCDNNCKEYNFQREVGENGTPHLQGFWNFTNGRHFDALKKLWPKMHIERVRNVAAARDYCKKAETKVGDTIAGGSSNVIDPLMNKELYTWQKEVINICDTVPDDRTIHWFYDERGCSGKTTLAKHLCLKYPADALYLSGGPANCKWGITSFLHDKKGSKLVRNEKNLRIAIFDFVRTVEDRISYEALEAVKNGIFFNTKYESMMITFNCPHVIVFANFVPEIDKLSKDRWNIVDIEAFKLLDV